MVKLLHQKIPLDSNGKPIFEWELAKIFHDQIVNSVGDEYKVLTTPTDIEVLEEDDMVIFQSKVVTVKELLEKLK